MGSLYQPSTQRKHLVWVSYYGGEHGNMKLSLVVVAVILAVLISSCEAQKGGAKSAMRNRGRGGSSGRGGTRGRNNYGDSSARGPDDKFGNGTGRRACVGLCYLRKLQGKPPKEEKAERRKPCVGLCYREKLRKLRESRKTELTWIQLPIYLPYLTS